MGVQPSRNPSEREMRSLDLEDFLALISADIKELDELRRQRRRADTEEKPSRSSRKGRSKVEEPEPEADEEAVVPLSLHSVTCCGKHLGDFTEISRVRCPFCEHWHRAGDFPIHQASR